jgi:uncharacterized protein YxjI
MFEGNAYLVKERVAMLKLTDTYDVFDAASGAALATAREEPPAWAKYLRLVMEKKLLPTIVNIYDAQSNSVLMSIHKPVRIFRSKVTVRDAEGGGLGYFKSKILSLGGGFWIHDMKDQKVGEVKGDWKGWNFKLLGPTGGEIGAITKKWGGIGKELFTSADNYIVALRDGAASNPKLKMLMLAAGLAIDIVYKEGA